MLFYYKKNIFLRIFPYSFRFLSLSGRCLIAVGNARSAEHFLQYSMKLLTHPDTILLLGKFIFLTHRKFHQYFINTLKFCEHEMHSLKNVMLSSALNSALAKSKTEMQKKGI
jgi:hypothetical protein